MHQGVGCPLGLLLREAKVGDLHLPEALAAVPEHNVAGGDVAVHDPLLLVDVVHGHDEPDEDAPDVGLGHPAALLSEPRAVVEQREALDHLHDDPEAALLDKGLVVGDDVGVRQLRQDLDLLGELADLLLLLAVREAKEVRVVERELLDGHHARAALPPGLVHGPKGALPEHLDDDVVPHPALSPPLEEVDVLEGLGGSLDLLVPQGVPPLHQVRVLQQRELVVADVDEGGEERRREQPLEDLPVALHAEDEAERHEDVRLEDRRLLLQLRGVRSGGRPPQLLLQHQELLPEEVHPVALPDLVRAVVVLGEPRDEEADALDLCDAVRGQEHLGLRGRGRGASDRSRAQQRDDDGDAAGVVDLGRGLLVHGHVVEHPEEGLAELGVPGGRDLPQDLPEGVDGEEVPPDALAAGREGEEVGREALVGELVLLEHPQEDVEALGGGRGRKEAVCVL